LTDVAEAFFLGLGKHRKYGAAGGALHVQKVLLFPGERGDPDEFRMEDRLEKELVSQGVTAEFSCLLETFKPQCSSAFTTHISLRY
jgi:hypothetical protein